MILAKVEQKLLLFFAFLLLGCGRPVYFGEPAVRDAGLMPVATEQPIRIYLDREGSLYPEAAAKLRIDKARFAYHKSFLRAYYHVKTKADWREAQATEWKNIQAYYGLAAQDASQTKDDDKDAKVNFALWKKLQEAMRARLVKELNQHLQATKPEALVIMIHGYNNDVNDAEWYGPLTQRVRERFYQGKRVQFLEVRWDGGKSKTGIGIWGNAQYTMYPVALTLRHVLANLENKALPINIVAHSTGAPLTCIMLWDSESAMSGDGPTVWGDKCADLYKMPEYQTPLPNPIRVALLAPAMPSSHFKEYQQRNGHQQAAGSDNYRCLIFGHNKHDAATGKWFLSANWSSIGATSLGVDAEEYCTSVRPRVEATGTVTHLIDFTSGLKQLGERSAHGVRKFMRVNAAFDKLLDMWLADAVPENEPFVEDCN